MGVEYRHFLVVNDPAWIPLADTAGRIDAVLRKWRLVADAPEVFDLAGGGKKSLGSAIPTGLPGAGIAVIYPMIEGAAVHQVTGLNAYGGGEEDHYFKAIIFVEGLDYRIHPSSEGLFVQIKPPSFFSRQTAKPYPENFMPPILPFDEAIPHAANAAPPKVTVEVEASAKANFAAAGFKGFWRAALVLDSGKNLPAFVDGKHLLPARPFVADVSEALRAEVCEVGEIY